MKIFLKKYHLHLMMAVFAFYFLMPLNTIAQELNCNVQVISQQIQGTNRSIFKTLQESVYEFLNNRNWTRHVYSYNERIECNVLINLSEPISSDEFRGSIQIQARRPVFNSTYNSVLLNIRDDNVRFRYVENEPLEFNETVHRSNLTSLLAYYAYIILGFDYDSYSLYGGTEYFEKAQKIVDNAQNATEPGWKPYEGSSYRNRYWLVYNLLDDMYRPVREFNYRYHRLGLDMMSEQTGQGRANIEEAFRLLREVYRQQPDPYMYLLQVVLDAKTDEIVNIFRAVESPPDERRRVHEILTEIDPSNIGKYDTILNPETL